MRFIFYIFCFFLLSSCSLNPKNWLDRQKEGVLTHLASKVISTSLSDENIEDLLDLFDNLAQANTCEEMRIYIEDNSTLRFYEKEWNLSEGFLFEALVNYDYQADLVNPYRTRSEQIVFAVVSAWQTKNFNENINAVIDKVEECQ